jgi:Concanavalin A-like lectin/glucanases superfamily
MKPRRNPFLAAALTSGLMLPAAHAAVAPYTSADADTTYLYHFNEAAGASSAANTGSTGDAALSVNGNPYAGDGVNQPLITTVLGSAGFSGFGNAANVTGSACLGVDADGNGAFQPGDYAPVGPDQLTDHSTIFGASNAFTLEAMVNVPSITSGNREIICTDNNGAAVDRGFQFRINATGNLEFNFIGSTPAAFTAPIPTTGTHGFAANQWFHVALTYDGTTLTYYWTKVDATVAAANPIATNAIETVDLNDDAVLIIGNEGRATGNLGGEPLGGLIDEVRISKVARGASQFIFIDTDDTDGDGMLDGWETTNFGDLSQTAAGDFDGDLANNLAEFTAGSNPNNNLSVPGDIDGDALADAWENSNFGNLGQMGSADPDNDFATNEDEETAASNPNLKTSFPDSEPDGLSDPWELFYFGDTASQAAAGDPDGDLYNNTEEFTLGTDPGNQLSAPDSDLDGLNDGWEALHFFTAGDDRATVLAKQDGPGDADSDGYTNEQEETAVTNPKTAERPSDLDGDGLVDSWELFHFSSLDETAAGNPDGDAGTNLQEQNAGSNPTLAASVPTDIDGDAVLDSAEVFQPYTADSDTLHLWHLDEADQPAADAGNSPLSLTALNANGRMWAPSLAGFGTGLNPAEGRGTAAGGTLAARSLAGGTADDVTTAYTGADGEFTFEAIVRLDFDPAVAPASTAPMQIVSGENDGTQGAARVWQFRIVPIGGPGNLAGTAPLIEFINLRGEVGVQSIVAPLPAGTDPDAALQGGWYHVAVTYNGSEATADNLKFYWTLLDPSRTAANELFSGQLTQDLIVATPDLTLGNEGRDNGGSTDSFLGVIDEVRISSVARTPSQFHFISTETPDNLDDAWELLYFGDLDETDSGDFDNDGTDNLTEFRLGLNPTSGSSRFAATGGSGGSIQWPSATGTAFKIERSTDLGVWTTLEAAYPGSAGSTSYTDPAPPSGKAFYRVTLNP